MKKILILPFLILSVVVMAQPPTPPGHTKISSRYDWLSGAFSTLRLPIGPATPTTYGTSIYKGDVFVDTAGIKLRLFDGTYWRMFPDSVYATTADSLLVVRYGTRKDTLAIKANGGGGGGSSKINALLAADNTNTIDNGQFTQTWRWNSLGGSSGTGLSLNSAASSSITNTILALSRTGSGSGAILNKALQIDNTATGASSTNIGISASASGASANYAIIAPAGNVGFGTSTPSAKAILDLTSTTQGFLAPRMNTTQQNAISSPATGLLIYNTDSAAFRYYTGSAWTTMIAGSAAVNGTADHNLKVANPNLNTNKATQTLTDGATITWNSDNGFNAQVTLGGNRTLSITNSQNGDYGTLKVTQDGTGGRTLTVPNGTVNLNPASLATTTIAFFYDGVSYYWASSYNVYLTTAVDTIYRTVGKDSIQFTIGGRYHSIKDSTGGGGAGSLTVGTSAITSGTANRLLYEDATNKLNEAANGVFDGTEMRFGGITDKGAYTLQNEGGTYFYNGDVEQNGASGHTWEVLNYSTLNMTAASGDLAFNFTAQGAGTWAHQIFKSGNGSGTNYATTDYWIHGATDQKWYCGPYGTLDYWIQDITNVTKPFVITSGAAAKISLAGNNTSPNSSVQVNGSLARKYNSTATGITLDATYDIVEVTATGQTITLPTAASITGREYTIKLTASGSCTVATTSSQNIDAATTYSLSAQYKYVTVVSNGSNWIIVANN